MLRQLILIVIISITAGCAQADPNLIHHIENAQIVNYSVDYLHDKNNNINFNEVIKAQFSSLSKRHSFGTHYEVIWYRITVTNLSKTDIHQYLHENLAYYSKEIELYESLDSNRFSEKKYNLWDSNVGSKLTGSTLVYPLDIKAESEKIIYIKKKAFTHQLLDIEIYNEKNSIQALINKNNIPNIIISCLCSLALYNLMLFFFNKQKEFIYYSLYLFNSSAGLFYLYGTASHNALFYGEKVYWLNVSAILVSLFLTLFVQEVFRTREKYKNINKLLNATYVLVAINILIACLVDMSLAIDGVGIVFGFSFFTLLYMAVFLYRKKHPLIRVFIVAYFFYMSGISITLLMLMGYIPYSFITMHASGIGILIEAFLFSYLINFRIKQLEKEVVDLVCAGENLKTLATHDELTNIFNRRAFIEYSINAFSMATRHEEPMSMLMIDLDYFKKVNDCFGHHVGDTVLVSFSRIVSGIIREEDVFGRIGGEEFCVILPKLNRNDALLVAEKIRKKIANYQIMSGNSYIRQTVSIGVSSMVKNDKSYVDMQRRADQALYKVKNTGRNNILFM